MSIRLSHSAKSKYLLCPKSYQLHYIEKWRPVTMSSALAFGSAIDNSLNHLLTNKDQAGILDETLNLFNREWEQGTDSKRNKIDLPLNPNLKYFKSDWDADLLEKADWSELFKYDKNLFDSRTKVEDMLKNKIDWLDIPEDMRMVYKYANWLCLKAKGKLLITAFYNDILPQIKKVLAVQMNVELDDGEGNILNGVVDYVAELHDGRIMIMDNKTTSTEYDEESVTVSEQLATYYAMLNIFNEDPEHQWKHKIDGAGYSVMSKKIIKDITKTCKQCGHVAEGSHKTCDNTVNGKRCNGEWDKLKKFSVKTQFITGTIHEKFAKEVLENSTTVKSCIELGLFPSNFSACADQFGQPCQYIGLCHKGDSKGLINVK